MTSSICTRLPQELRREYAQSWRQSDVELGIKKPKRPTVSAPASKNPSAQQWVLQQQHQKNPSAQQWVLQQQLAPFWRTTLERQSCSPERSQLLLLRRSPLGAWASSCPSQLLCLCMEFWKPDSDYLQYRFSMPNNVRLKSQWKRCTRTIMNPLYTWVNSGKKSKQDCFACSMLPALLAYVGITSWTKHVTSLPSFHTRLPWQPPKHHTLTSFQGVHNKMVAKKNKNEWMMY